MEPDHSQRYVIYAVSNGERHRVGWADSANNTLVESLKRTQGVERIEIIDQLKIDDLRQVDVAAMTQRKLPQAVTSFLTDGKIKVPRLTKAPRRKDKKKKK